MGTRSRFDDSRRREWDCSRLVTGNKLGDREAREVKSDFHVIRIREIPQAWMSTDPRLQR